MPSFEVGEVLQDAAQIIVYPSGSYDWFRIYVRLSSSSTAVVYDEYFNDTGAFAVYAYGLSPSTSYTVNVAYGTESTNATNWIGSQTFYTKDAIATTTMGITCGDGVYSVTIQYNNEYGGVDTTTVYDYEYITVAQNTTQHVTSIRLNDGYNHPVTCSGQTIWEMTNTDGAFIDATLVMYSEEKTFTFTATGSSGGGNGKVWIQGNWYQPYIYTGTWTPATPCINNGTWTEITGN